MSQGVNYERLAYALSVSLDKYLGRPSDKKFGLVNEVLSRRLLFGKLFRRMKTDWDGGPHIQFPLQFNRSNVGGWTGPYAKLALKTTKGPTYGKVPIRVYGWAWHKSFLEIELNKGPEIMLRNLLEDSKQDVCVDTIMAMEEAFLARDGNYLHDGTGADYVFPYGLRYWATIDGLHITGDTSKSVAEVNPYSNPLHRNQYINPVTSSDRGTDGRIQSVWDLPRALDRAMQQMSFDSPQVWGSLAADVNAKDFDPTDYDRAVEPEDLRILTDMRTSTDFRRVLFDREDNVGKDQSRGRPVWKGIEAEESDKLGMNSYGYGYDDDGNAMWTDRGGSYANGQWANYGEMIIANMKFLHVAVHPDHFPKLYPAYKPEGMEAIAHEGSIWFNTLCRSRRRGLFYIGPYNLNQAS